jgi:hypothetical protein
MLFRSPSTLLPGPQNLNLTVRGTGPGFRISWNCNAPALQQAKRGVLYIRDGDRQTFTDLSATQLQEGSITYQAKSAEPGFRLDVYSTEPNAVGFVQVVELPSLPSTRSGAARSPAGTPALPPPRDLRSSSFQTNRGQDKFATIFTNPRQNHLFAQPTRAVAAAGSTENTIAVVDTIGTSQGIATDRRS